MTEFVDRRDGQLVTIIGPWTGSVPNMRVPTFAQAEAFTALEEPLLVQLVGKQGDDGMPQTRVMKRRFLRRPVFDLNAHISGLRKAAVTDLDRVIANTITTLMEVRADYNTSLVEEGAKFEFVQDYCTFTAYLGRLQKLNLIDVLGGVTGIYHVAGTALEHGSHIPEAFANQIGAALVFVDFDVELEDVVRPAAEAYEVSAMPFFVQIISGS